MNGSIITAKSITATKIAVDDLVAFNATIAGINMTDGTLYSGVKASADNTTKGFYLDREGQVSIGDGTNFLKYIKNKEGLWKLSISAGSIVLSSSGTDLDTSMGESIKTFTNEFYASKSPTELIGGQWTKTAPVWTEGIYIWERKLIEHNNGSLEYVPSENGICITGNTGAQGETGQNGKDAVTLHILSSNGNLFKNSMLSTTLTVTITVPKGLRNGNIIEKFQNNLLWSGVWFGEVVPNKTSCALSQLVTNQPHGIVLVFSNYDSKEGAKDQRFNSFFVPKAVVAVKSGKGWSFTFANNTFGQIASKYLYISDGKILGHADNKSSGTGGTGIKYDNALYVLRYVYGV